MVRVVFHSKDEATDMAKTGLCDKIRCVKARLIDARAMCIACLFIIVLLERPLPAAVFQRGGYECHSQHWSVIIECMIGVVVS